MAGGPTQILAEAASPEHEAAFATFQLWCKQHDVSQNQVLNAVIGRLTFCLRNYTQVDTTGNPTVAINLGNITLKTRANARKQRRGPRRKWDCAL